MHDDRERELFEASLKLSPGERSEFLRANCGGDRALAERVHHLLAVQTDAHCAGTRALAAEQLPDHLVPDRHGRAEPRGHAWQAALGAKLPPLVDRTQSRLSFLEELFPGDLTQSVRVGCHADDTDKGEARRNHA